MKSNIFIISGPSGAGEDSIIDGLKKTMPIERIVTTTTRKMRPREKSGREYYFISHDEFNKLIKEKKLFEYAKEYNDNYYGVTYDEIGRVKNSGKIGIWKIEYKGVITAKKIIPGIIAIFINAPLEILEKRIRGRGNVTEEFIKNRLEYTKEWLKHLDIYDYLVENEEGRLNQTISRVSEIIKKNAKLAIDKTS
ncbi:MAG: guanylate kinase [Patescibacteria group bacterium]|nr:guanylate kinase [Patescibacteria group bacterium]